MKEIDNKKDYAWYHRLRKNNDNLLVVSSHDKESYDESVAYHRNLGYDIIEEYYITKEAQQFSDCDPYWSAYMQKGFKEKSPEIQKHEMFESEPE